MGGRRGQVGACRLWSVESGVWGLKFGFQGLGYGDGVFRVWGMEFGIQGLGYEV
jgi:hypothetical protein